MELKIPQIEKAGIIGTITLVARDLQGKETNRIVTKNLIMQGSQTGKDILVQYLIGNGLTGGINYGAIGTSTTPVVVTDTQLGAESARISSPVYTDSAYNVAKIAFYFPDAALTNQTYYEFGTFVAGTSTPNSGNIFNHALFATPYTKSAGNNTTIECDFTFS